MSKATVTLIKKTFLEELIESKNVAKIKEILELKEEALLEAEENIDYYTKIGLEYMVDNETARVQLLLRDIQKLKNTLQSINQ